jgi:hypothetical protein
MKRQTSNVTRQEGLTAKPRVANRKERKGRLDLVRSDPPEWDVVRQAHHGHPERRCTQRMSKGDRLTMIIVTFDV